jgi:hypothetical protein
VEEECMLEVGVCKRVVEVAQVPRNYSVEQLQAIKKAYRD